MTLSYKTIVVFIALFTTLLKPALAQGSLKTLARQLGGRIVEKTLNSVIKPASTPAGKQPENSPANLPAPDTVTNQVLTPAPHSTFIVTDTLINGQDTVYHFNAGSLTSRQFVTYALSLKGTPYLYGSTNPAYGLDCSGFITHVFNHFNIQVPRRAYDFKNAENKVSVTNAKPGDLILFTGPDAASQIPGHMGIVTASGTDIQFVHASSGKAAAVTTGRLSYSYFKPRLLAIVRVFN